MTVTEIVDELRATRPRAGEALRLQVMTAASTPPVRAESLWTRLRNRRLLLVVPAAAGLAVVAAVAVGVTRPTPVAREAAAPVQRDAATTESARSSVPSTATGAYDASAAMTQKAQAPPGTVSGRAQRYVASLTLGVEDTDELSEATQRALSIARDLGGFVVAVRYATGEDGAASVTLRVPSERAGDAVTRLSGLGTILAQNVQIDDLQESLDGMDKALQQLQAQLAALNAQLDGELSPAERARLQERRAQVQAQLRDLRASRRATAEEARLATFQVELRTEQDEGVAAPGSRLDRALDRALAVLAWEAVVALAIVVALAPVVLLGAAVWLARRGHRRRENDRLLAAS